MKMRYRLAIRVLTFLVICFTIAFQDEWEDEQPGSITGLANSGVKSSPLATSLGPRVNSISREMPSTSQVPSVAPYTTPPRPKTSVSMQWDDENRNGGKGKGTPVLIC